MPNYVREVGKATRITTSALTTLGAGNPVALIGLGVATVLTGQKINLYDGVGGTTELVGTLSLDSHTYFAVPAMCLSGVAVRVTNDDVDLTIYWNPAS